MDALTEVLRGLRLTGAVFLEAEFTAPWCISARIEPEDCSPFMPMPAQVIAYHYVVEGDLLVGIEGQPWTSATAGHLLLLPRNDRHLLGSDADMTPVETDGLIEPAGSDGRARIRHGGGGALTRLICGFLGGDAECEPLLASLPPLVRLDLAAGGKRPWIEGSIRYAIGELVQGGPAAAASLTRLAELLFAEAVRDYADTLPADRTGWLAGLRDRHVGRALALMHARPARDWTLDELAQAIGLSRSAFADRFTRQIGLSPMRYLSRRRLSEAAAQLSGGSRTVAEIAFQAGYDSEAAFSRAFKREFGRPPAAFRSESRLQPTA